MKEDYWKSNLDHLKNGCDLCNSGALEMIDQYDEPEALEAD